MVLGEGQTSPWHRPGIPVLHPDRHNCMSGEEGMAHSLNKIIQCVGLTVLMQTDWILHSDCPGIGWWRSRFASDCVREQIPSTSNLKPAAESATTI